MHWFSRWPSAIIKVKTTGIFSSNFTPKQNTKVLCYYYYTICYFDSRQCPNRNLVHTFIRPFSYFFFLMHVLLVCCIVYSVYLSMRLHYYRCYYDYHTGCRLVFANACINGFIYQLTIFPI